MDNDILKHDETIDILKSKIREHEYYLSENKIIKTEEDINYHLSRINSLKSEIVLLSEYKKTIPSKKISKLRKMVEEKQKIEKAKQRITEIDYFDVNGNRFIVVPEELMRYVTLNIK